MILKNLGKNVQTQMYYPLAKTLFDNEKCFPNCFVEEKWFRIVFGWLLLSQFRV